MGCAHHAEPRKGVALGSGFFVSADGHVVTNNHVVENAVSVSIAMDDGRVVDAHVVGATPRRICAAESRPKGDYPFVALAKETPRVGDWVLAIGNPFGLGGSVTAGIVSATAGISGPSLRRLPPDRRTDQQGQFRRTDLQPQG